MNIVVISYNYPDAKQAVFTFVKTLVDQWGKLGHNITVISPFSISKTRSLCRFEELEMPPSIKVVRPKIISLSNYKFGKLSLTQLIHKRAIERELNKLDTVPDVIYCHFWVQSIYAHGYATRHNIPIVVASGESTVPRFLSLEPFRSMCNAVSKVVCVSSKNMNESIELKLTSQDKCEVFPNAIDNNLFKVSEQNELKKSLSIEEEDIVLAFVGWFIERKGSRRVSEAIKRVNDPHIKVIFIGSGPDEPDCPGIIFKDSLPHDKIPDYLNCADAFILPTLKEGCCNAIIEAMACGLPIISSDRDFNWDILNCENSIMVDPTNIDEIADAIEKIKDKDIRSRMSLEALRVASDLKIEVRASKILSLLENVTNSQKNR